MDTLLSAIDCSQPFQVVADLKLRQVFTMITSRGAATLLLHTMDLASSATFQIWEELADALNRIIMMTSIVCQ